jgi:hypothetical protein
VRSGPGSYCKAKEQPANLGRTGHPKYLPFRNSKAGSKHHHSSNTFRMELSSASMTKRNALSMYNIPCASEDCLAPFIVLATVLDVEAITNVEASHWSQSLKTVFSPCRLLSRLVPSLLKSRLRGLLLCLLSRLDFLSHLILDS